MTEVHQRAAFDERQMLERLGGDAELLRDVLDVFIGEQPQMIGELRAAVASGDAESICKSAHTLKGALLNISANRAAELALQLERMGWTAALAGSSATLERLETELQRLHAEIAP